MSLSALIFVRLETHVPVRHVYNRRKEDVKQEGREHAPLAKALIHSESPKTHSVVESHACLHTILEMTNDQDHFLWHAKTCEYFLEEGSVNGVIRFGNVDKAYIQQSSFLPRQHL